MQTVSDYLSAFICVHLGFLTSRSGDSIELRIQDSNLLLVDYSRGSRPAHIVIALINSEAVVEKYLRQKGRVIPRSANPKYSDIEIAESDQFVIAGVALGIVEGAV